MQTEVLGASSSAEAKSFWLKKENEVKWCNGSTTNDPDNGYFKRQQWTLAQNDTQQQFDSNCDYDVWNAIYSTIKDRRSSRGKSTSSSSGVESLSPRSSTGSTNSIVVMTDCVETTVTGRFENSIMSNDTHVDTYALEVDKNHPKRYETKCYFMPKLTPVWYSQTVVLKIGSTKRQFKESVEYQNKLLPYRWIETMTTATPDSLKPLKFVTNVEIPISDEFDIVDLQPQQLIAEQIIYSNEHVILISEM